MIFCAIFNADNYFTPEGAMKEDLVTDWLALEAMGEQCECPEAISAHFVLVSEWFERVHRLCANTQNEIFNAIAMESTCRQ